MDDTTVTGLSLRQRYADRRSRLGVGVLLLGALAMTIAALRIYQAFADAPRMVALELAGSAGTARAVLDGGCDTTVTLVACVDGYRSALLLDVLLILGYVIAFTTVGLVANNFFASPGARRTGRLVVGLGTVVGLLDLAENIALGIGMSGRSPSTADTPWQVAAALAAAKFSIALPTVVVALAAACVLLIRCVLPAADYGWTNRAVEGGAGEIGPPVRPACEVGAPPATDPAQSLPPGRRTGGLAVCLSGGGIRAACVALGALQVFRSDELITPRWTYLFSVSGGGYASGAVRMATSFSDPGSESGATRFLGPGSPEESHLRRHGRYVADSASEWVRALATVFRNLLISLGLLVAVACATGTVLGAFYAVIPLGTYPEFVAGPDPRTGIFREATTATGPLVAVAALVLLWIVSAIGHGGVRAFTGTPRLRWSAVTGAFGAGAALVAVLGLGVPTLVLLVDRGFVALNGDATLVSQGGAGTVLLTYMGALGSLAWRQRSRVDGVRKLFGKGGDGVTARVSSGWLLTALVWLVIVVVIAAGLFVSTVTLSETIRFVTTDGAPGPWLAASWILVALAVFVSLLIDQTSLSLHPFYRRRLASIFAVRRSAAGLATELDYRQPTTLSLHGGGPGPHTVFCCAAQLSGPSRTPPGARATGFTMSHDWVGGPQVGWLSTRALEQETRAAFQGDATILGAMAISGAAIASAMGSQAGSYQALLALSNVRLGAWLPNPDWLAGRAVDPSWSEPRYPRVRRLTYFLRELFGRYSDKDRLLLVTDGGHFDNLGLVEALRHQPDSVIVVDASGDAPPIATTLAESIALARDELGVVIDLEGTEQLVPGSATVAPGPASLAALHQRLSADVAVSGTIRYKGRSSPGRLIVVKSRLTPDMPYELLAFANGHAEFPYDSTSDQWFDHGQFDAYRQLGEALGRRAAQAYAVADVDAALADGSLEQPPAPV